MKLRSPMDRSWMRGRFFLTAGVFAAGVGLLLTAQFAGTSGARATPKIRNGGTFRVSEPGIDSIDPALSVNAGIFLTATCAQLMRYADNPLPSGLRLVPEAATGYPRV